MMSSLWSPLLSSRTLYPLLLGYLLYLCLRTFYRLYFHPLAKFPGPKIVAVSRWYEYYWEVYRSGRFGQKVDRMHQQYGPIVRVGPNEIHVADPSFYESLYNFDSSIDRPKSTLDNLQFSSSFERHKSRRRVFEPHFSKQAVYRLEPCIRSNVTKFCERLAEARNSKTPASISIIARCFTADVISEYVFAQSYGFLDDTAESEKFLGAQNTLFKTVFLYTNFRPAKWFFNSIGALPEWMLPNNEMASAMGPFIQVSCPIHPSMDL